ncbi:MAG: AMP-dependent synthetase, partial [Myxococcaceae bacterium]|nr:AMP-dependent synthetase [Myxococcaceae bacterium]
MSLGRDVWGLAQRGTAPLLIDAQRGEQLSYEAVHARACELARELSCSTPDGQPRRGLVFVAAGIDVGTIVSYLAALAAGHAVFLLDRAAHATLQQELEARYRPDFVLSAAGRDVSVGRRAGDPACPLHPELAVLLSTSGTTGSPKLVRLSYENVRANARSIATYL